MSARDEILRAYTEILNNDGERAATLEAVAARANVSKGGLLYHFGSKRILAEALVERFTEVAEQDLEAMRTSPDGPAAYYLHTSNFQNTEFDQLIIAVYHLSREFDDRPAEAMRRIQQAWFDLILEEVGDRAVTRAIVLMGDGLYYNAMLQGSVSAPDDAVLDELLGVVDRLRQS